MYAAASAAINSACLSRQVCAAVTDANGDLLATGWNDVPIAFGDLYVADLKGDPTDIHDKRCWNYGGKCYNDEEKIILAEHIDQTLEQVLPPEKKKLQSRRSWRTKNYVA
jgi:deoxycytidylate deaminase